MFIIVKLRAYLLFVFIFYLNVTILGEEYNYKEFIEALVDNHTVIHNNFNPNSITIERSTYDGDKNLPIKSTENILRLNDNAFYVHVLSDDGVEEISCLNPQYDFTIQRYNSGAWTISSINDIHGAENIRSFASYEAFCDFNSFLNIAHIPLRWLLTQCPGVEITNYKRNVLAEDTEEVYISLNINNPGYLYKDTDVPGYVRDVSYETVAIKFNIALYGYIPYEYTYTQRGNSRTVSFSNFTEINGFKIPLNMSSNVIRRNDGKSWNDQNIRMIFDTNNNIDANIFRLSHYGIPEPDFNDSKSNCVQYILMSVGCGMFLYAALRIYRKRKLQEKIS